MRTNDVDAACLRSMILRPSACPAFESLGKPSPIHILVVTVFETCTR